MTDVLEAVCITCDVVVVSVGVTGRGEGDLGVVM